MSPEIVPVLHPSSSDVAFMVSGVAATRNAINKSLLMFQIGRLLGDCVSIVCLLWYFGGGVPSP